MIPNINFYSRCSGSLSPNIKIIFYIIKLWTAGYGCSSIKIG
nr:MAG TPA: hypothetical protein [Caudoviricetes sp.]